MRRSKEGNDIADFFYTIIKDSLIKRMYYKAVVYIERTAVFSKSGWSLTWPGLIWPEILSSGVYYLAFSAAISFSFSIWSTKLDATASPLPLAGGCCGFTRRWKWGCWLGRLLALAMKVVVKGNNELLTRISERMTDFRVIDCSSICEYLIFLT